MTALTAVARTMTHADDPHPCSCGGVKQLFDVPRVADLLDLSMSSVYELIADGRLPAYMVPGRGKQRTRRRVRAADLRAYVNSLPRVQPTA